MKTPSKSSSSTRPQRIYSGATKKVVILLRLSFLMHTTASLTFLLRFLTSLTSRPLFNLSIVLSLQAVVMFLENLSHLFIILRKVSSLDNLNFAIRVSLKPRQTLEYFSKNAQSMLVSNTVLLLELYTDSIDLY